jgi:hypothetical protein
MLPPEGFGGKRRAMLNAADAFWCDFRAQTTEVVIEAEGDLDRIKAQRLITFFDAGRKDMPGAVEFSYRYGDEHEAYGGTAARRAFETFTVLQIHLGKWVAPNARTKTAFVFGWPVPASRFAAQLAFHSGRCRPAYSIHVTGRSSLATAALRV